MSRRISVLLVVVVGSAVVLEGAHQSRVVDPATNLVRARLFLTTTADTAQVAVSGATVADALFVVRSGGGAVRGRRVGDTVQLLGNDGGQAADLQIDLLLSAVLPDSSVVWQVDLGSSGRAELSVNNANGPPIVAVDRFDTIATTSTFSTDAALLRRGGPLVGPGASGSHLQLAFFYPWYDLTTWSSTQFLDVPAQPYSTDDPSDMRRAMSEVRSAGLDGVAVSWQGVDFGGGWNHRRMLTALDGAAAAGVKVAALLETTVANPEHQQDGVPPSPATVLEWLIDVVDRYTAHRGYLKVDGRPVVVAYAAQRLTAAQWSDVLARLRETGRDVLLVGEGTDETRLSAFNGLFSYASNIFPGDQIRDFDRSESLTARTYHLLSGDAIGRRLWVATVSPGYDDTRLTDGRVPRVTDRENGAYYDRQWQSALDMRADWVIVTSWNEWYENTAIEASRRYGDSYVQKTRGWTTKFREQLAVAR